MTPQLFTEYLRYLLGEFVLGLCAMDSGGLSFAFPPWPLIISYDHAIRSKAMALVRKGATFKDALKLAWEDPVVKERHFTTPLCLESGRKRQADTSSSDYRPEPPKQHQKGKKGKGSGKSGKDGTCASATADGRPICYAFNNSRLGCKKAKCRFAHVCGVCFAKDVPMFRCPHAGGKAGGQ